MRKITSGQEFLIKILEKNEQIGNETTMIAERIEEELIKIINNPDDSILNCEIEVKIILEKNCSSSAFKRIWALYNKESGWYDVSHSDSFQLGLNMTSPYIIMRPRPLAEITASEPTE